MPTGAEEGRIFEKLFIRQAQRNGLLAIKNHLSAKHGWKGRLILIKSELDFKLITQSGRVGFFDCKSFAGEKFTYSMIDPDQMQRAITYVEWNVPAGFVIWFRKYNRVVFFSVATIANKGPGTSFGPRDGDLLGRYEEFNLKRLMGA